MPLISNPSKWYPHWIGVSPYMYQHPPNGDLHYTPSSLLCQSHETLLGKVGILMNKSTVGVCIYIFYINILYSRFMATGKRLHPYIITSLWVCPLWQNWTVKLGRQFGWCCVMSSCLSQGKKCGKRLQKSFERRHSLPNASEPLTANISGWKGRPSLDLFISVIKSIFHHLIGIGWCKSSVFRVHICWCHSLQQPRWCTNLTRVCHGTSPIWRSLWWVRLSNCLRIEFAHKVGTDWTTSKRRVNQVVECKFGVYTAKWHVLLLCMQLDVENAIKVILACCVLQNLFCDKQRGTC